MALVPSKNEFSYYSYLVNLININVKIALQRHLITQEALTMIHFRLINTKNP
jgi:hypothetical protein